MLTNILDESTMLLYYGEGSREMAESAFHIEPENGAFMLPGSGFKKEADHSCDDGSCTAYDQRICIILQ